MLIVCPSCASAYEIDLDRVGPEGRSVRCAACRETWFISPDAVSAALEAEMTAAMMAASGAGAEEGRASAQADLDAWEATLAAEPEPELKSAPAPEAATPGGATRKRPTGKPGTRKPPRAKGRAFAPAALALALVAGLGLAILARTAVVAVLPQSAGLYARIGLPVNLRGLDFRDVVAFQTPGEGAQGQLVVEGDLVGVASAGAQVPALEVEVRDARDQPLYRWHVAPPRPALEKGETARFRASLSAPPAQGRSVRVHFASAGTAAKDDVDASRP